MTVGEAKQFLYDLVLLYHPNDTIVWTKTGGVKPKSPFITLAVRNVERSALPIANDVGENYYNYSMIFEINLYTIGKPIAGTSAYENTAIEDLEEFVRFLDSEEITDKTVQADICIQLNSAINDLSELIGDAKFNYRAMAEFMVTYTGKAGGRYGVGGAAVIPNSSGGGDTSYAEAETFEIDEIEIKEDTENE